MKYIPIMWIPKKRKPHLIDDIQKILSDGSLNEVELRVIIFIAKSAAKDGYCYAKLSTLTKQIGKNPGETKAGSDGKRQRRDEPRILRAIKSLEEQNYLRSERFNKQYSFYALGKKLVTDAPINEVHVCQISTHDVCKKSNPCVLNKQPMCAKKATMMCAEKAHMTASNSSEIQDNTYEENTTFDDGNRTKNRTINREWEVEIDGFQYTKTCYPILNLEFTISIPTGCF
jgi:hypothetical protein